MPVDSYWLLLLLGLGRLLVVGLVLYGGIYLLFPLRSLADPVGTQTERRWGRGLLACALLTALVLGLVLLHVYDGLMLVSSLGLLIVGALWWRARRNVLADRYARLLDLFDRPPALRSVLRRSTRRDGLSPLLMGGLLGGLVLGSALLRLAPLMASPAPYSLPYYRLLQTAKHLQSNTLFPGGIIEPLGLQGISVALHTLTAVDLGIVIRLLGVLSALLLLAGIYVAARRYGGHPLPSLLAAGLFGIGSPLLPYALNNQIEATPVLLAAAYALPTWYFLCRYLLNGHRSNLGIGGAGLGLLLLTHAPVAGLTMGTMAGVSLLQSLAVPSWPQIRRALTVVGLSASSGALLGSLVALRRSVVPDLSAVPPFSIGGIETPLAAPEFSLFTYGVIVSVTILGLLVAAGTDRTPFRRSLSGALAATCAGLYATMHLAHVAPYAIPGVELSPAAPTLLLSGFLCVAVGGLLGRLSRLFGRRLRRLASAPVFPLLSVGVVTGALLTSVVLLPGSLLPSARPALEPSGYVRALYRIAEEATPYQWTAVSHYGTAALALNQGRFLAYDYFLTHYDPHTYDHTSRTAIPTRDLFLFVPSESATALLRDELFVTTEPVAGPMRRWIDTYQQQSTIFYEDEHLTVYCLSRAAAARPAAALLSPRSGLSSRIDP
jgi:hypothetical protein